MGVFQMAVVKRFLPFIIVGTVAVLTLGSATMLYRAGRPAMLRLPLGSASGNYDPKLMHVRGPADAFVTLEEFGDFECPPCEHLSGILNDLERNSRNRLRLVFHNSPLPIHQHALQAAFAAEAADLQGHFWEMHDLLYREQAKWSKADDVVSVFKGYAGELGLNREQFAKDIDGELVKARVAAERRWAETIGVVATPTVFVNGKNIRPPALDQSGLQAAINEALKSRTTR